MTKSFLLRTCNFDSVTTSIVLCLTLTACGGSIEEDRQTFSSPMAPTPIIGVPTFNKTRDSYTISRNASSISITDRTTASSTTLPASTAAVQFSDFKLNFLAADVSQLVNMNSQNQIIELYIAFFNRIPDADGLAYWIEELKKGQTPEAIANNFYNAAILYSAQTGYNANMNNSDFVRIIYQNVLARTGPTAPTDTEVNYWATQLDQGKISRGGLVISMLTSAHTFEGDPTYGWVPQLLNNKITVANYFCLQQGLNYLSPELSITKGMAIAAAVTPSDTAAAMTLIGVNDSGFNLFSSATNKVSILKLNAIPNPTGIRFGFWETFSRQDVTLASMGKRPTSRVGFDSWASIETSKGIYDFTGFDASNSADNYRRVHQYGESIYGAINIAFSAEITPGKQAIPTFYNGRITDPETRQAAKNFLAAYVQHMLKLVGSLTLTIDYEIMSNYRLSAAGSEARANEWADWYVEAAAVARKAAAEIGMSDRLKLQPIVNSNPLDPSSPISKGKEYNNWLVRVVAASDSLALDTYHSDPSLPNTDPKRTFDIIKFWIDNFSAGKDVIVTENGFNSVTQVIPSITRADRDWKTTGTEADQAEYYRLLFAQLADANKKDGIFHNQLKSFNLWSILDNPVKPATDEDRYFGLIRLDGTEKPAASVVREAIRQYENDAFSRPWNLTGLGTDVTSLLSTNTSTPINLTYSNGDQFEFLRYSENNLPSAKQYLLNLALTNSANVILCFNGNQCIYQEGKASYSIDVSKFMRPNTTNTMDIYFTNAVFPAITSIKGLQLKKL
ncbi:DUF4214 domain-containing protein [Undibacterium sp. LX40W]|uniref:DUF4214 domain-containing protein n=1 Tax=Undibacterium nitidum TaxID=2762298 RepID=A0A923HLJ3_9BURK|nr:MULTISPECIES: DUF4214 domain-containing protein [Undibacterium]MBC3881247.1 DUF4214 domain-containing protein [Undibacterium nitidum]MBC3891970.1 DUF4214 domain-containing protein [Undibacterium sp. LX40W]